MMSERIPVYKYVIFDLPFVIFVRDGLKDQQLQDWAEAYSAGKRPLPYSRYAPSGEEPQTMIIGGGLPVYIPQEPLGETYVVTLKDIQVGLKFLRRINPHRPTKLAGELPGDRTGRASFSSVRVTFNLSMIQPEYFWDMELFVSIAIDAVNHFIEHYRVLADRPYITPITASVIQEFHLSTDYGDGAENHQEYGAGSGPLHGFGGAIPEDIDNKIRQAIFSKEPPLIDDILDCEIRNYMDLQEWRLALIESAVLFESWLTRLLRTIAQQKGMSSHDIDALFTQKNGQPKSITSIASSIVKEIKGVNFAGTSEYDKWKTCVRDPRNDVVHGKVFEISRDEAQAAYEAVKKAISYLSK
ncbi:hypothetical protein ACFLV4_04125 [Chloroflexota bacterium]